MPVGTQKNTLYGLALPLLGRRCHWQSVTRHGFTDQDLSEPLARVFLRNRLVGGCVQRVREGKLGECYTVGDARLSPAIGVLPDTYFRTASVAKMACALLVMRLQTLGKLDVREDISAFWHKPIRNPNHPDVPIPLSALLSHTSSLADSQRYYRAYREPEDADAILRDPATYTAVKPLERFRYSNFAAGLVGCLLESRFGDSFAHLAQIHLFSPLSASATFDLRLLLGKPVASSYRVLPATNQPDFDAPARTETAPTLDQPDPQRHYLLASGSLFITAEGLARLCLPLIHGGISDGVVFLDAQSVANMTTPTSQWPEPAVRMRHGMGLLALEDPAIYPSRLLGHQGFAYGAVNGVFWDDRGNGFASLNSGASEKRLGHLSCLNRDLIDQCLRGGAHG